MSFPDLKQFFEKWTKHRFFNKSQNGPMWFENDSRDNLQTDDLERTDYKSLMKKDNRLILSFVIGVASGPTYFFARMKQISAYRDLSTSHRYFIVLDIVKVLALAGFVLSLGFFTRELTTEDYED